MNNIIIMSYNYYPDISPSSFRMNSLVQNLKKVSNEKINISVICSQPSRYNVKHQTTQTESINSNIKIYRSRKINITKTFFDSVISFILYFFLCLIIFFKLPNKFVVVTSAKLGTAFLCYLLSFLYNFKYIVDLRDIFSENIESLFKNYNLFISKNFKVLFLFFEKKILSKAINVNIVSDSFKEYYYSNGLDVRNWTLFKNGIDNVFLDYNFKNQNIKSKKKILYVGNNGIGQALDKILPYVARKIEDNYNFTIIGSGSNHNKLNKLINEMNIKNIELLGPLPRKEILKYYKEADILFLHLNDLDSFKRVLPSKIFEYIAIGKPIMAGIPNGFALKFLNENINHFIRFNSCDSKEFLKKIDLTQKLTINENEIKIFKQKFSRDNIMSKMAENIIDQINT